MSELATSTACPPLIGRIYRELEAPNWAPWLRFDAGILAAQKQVYPDGQFLATGPIGNPMAALSGNRIYWDGKVDTLGSWDTVAGPDHTYRDTYVPDGNTYVLMSLSVIPGESGRGLSSMVLNQLEEYSFEEDLEHVIGDFRPSEFGKHKRKTGEFNFDQYVHTIRPDGKRIDGWLRSMGIRGMCELILDPAAMIVPSTAHTVDGFRETYKPEAWWQVTDAEQISYLEKWHQPSGQINNIDEVWECGETGTWYLDRIADSAVYIESNVWGEVPYTQRN